MRTLLIVFVSLTSLYSAEKFGRGLTLREATSISALFRTPADYTGKVVQVKGKVTEVCELMGCWLQLQEAHHSLRVKVKDGEILFPKGSVGRNAVAEGVFTKIDLNQKQAIAWARHEAEERGQKFDATKIKTGVTIYQIQGTGAVLLD